MAWASRSGRAITNPEDPRAFGVCDRCGIWYNLHRLTYQYEWQGSRLMNLRFRVCPSCIDIPNPQLMARRLPPDPVPVADPRPENFLLSYFDPSQRSGAFIAQELVNPPPRAAPPAAPIETESGSAMEIE